MVSLFFIIYFFLPYINQLLENLGLKVLETNSFIERASAGYGRLYIWNQMVHAIIESPVIGYGWYQTSIAQYAVIDIYYGKEWVESSHNIILDIIIWCGIPLGIGVVSYFVYFYYEIMRNSININSIVSILMITPIIIHSLLEFPIFYSYFLIPLGFFSGILLFEKKVGFLTLPKFINIYICILGGGLMYFIYNDYNIACENLLRANIHELFERDDNKKLIEKNYIFDKQEAKSKWIAFKPETKVNKFQLVNFENVVKSDIGPYSLYKYARVLAYNGKKDEVRRVLLINYNLYGKEIDPSTLLKKNQK